MAPDFKRRETSASLYIEAESKTNRDNVKCLMILAAICLFCDLLNEVRIFDVAPIVMRIGTALGMLLYLIPSVVLMRPLELLHRKPDRLVYRGWHKYLIISFAWLGTAVTCVMLTHHTVIVMAVPIMIMAQYRDTTKLVHLTAVFATVCVLLGVYGGYFVGCFDGNLLQLALTDDNAADLALRFERATPTRMYELLTHYAIARELIVVALILLATKISRRSNKMLDRQVELQAIAKTEMQRKNDIQMEIIDGMANLIENRDTSTGEHVKRTSYYVHSIVEKLQSDSSYKDELPDKTADTIVRAAPLHDIGKIVVADRILQKPGKLTADEFEEIKHHASEGSMVIKNVLGNVEDADFLRTATDIAGGHHERWDGKGYPLGLKGEEIPLSARIMAVADVFDALVSKRVYKEPMPPEAAFALIESEAGKQFDPKVAAAFLSRKDAIIGYLNG